jgi:hypothetical protein
MCCENGCIGGNATIAPEKVSKKALGEFLNAGNKTLKGGYMPRKSC